VKLLEAKNSCSDALNVKLALQSEQVRVLSIKLMDDLLFELVT
jgi:hypothetical protein